MATDPTGQPLIIATYLIHVFLGSLFYCRNNQARAEQNPVEASAGYCGANTSLARENAYILAAIYQKLGVENRWEVATKGTELGTIRLVWLSAANFARQDFPYGILIVATLRDNCV